MTNLDFAVRRMAEDDLAAVAEIEAGVFTDWYRLYRKPQDPLPERTIDELRYATSLDPDANLVAIAADGAMVGFILGRTWGEVGWFGTFGVPTQFQGMGIGKALIESVTRYLRENCSVIGLETMPESGSNLGLYSKVGFGVTFPTVILDFSLIQQADQLRGLDRSEITLWSDGDHAARTGMLDDMRMISDQLMRGLDYTREVQAIHAHGLGETLIAMDGGAVAGFALLRTVPYRGQDASGRGYIHILAIHPEADADAVLLDLLRQIWSRGTSMGLTRLVTGLGGRHHVALDLLLRRGFSAVRAAIRMVDRTSPTEAFQLSAGVNVARWAG